MRNDGLSKGFEGEINADGTVTVPLHSWMLELVGTVVCDISVIDTAEDAEKKLTTTSFTLIVEQAAWGGDGITSDPQYDLLIDLLNTVESAGAMAEDALQKSTEANAVYDRMVEATRESEAIVTEWQNEIDKTNGRLDELIAMRPTDIGLDTIELDDGDEKFPFRATIISNGVNCYLGIEVSEVDLGVGIGNEAASNVHALPLNFAPLDTVSYETDTYIFSMTLDSIDKDIGTADVRFWLKSKVDDVVSVQAVLMYYPVLHPSVPEVSDARAGYDGTEYATAGNAVRAAQQMAAEATGLANNLIDDVKDVVDLTNSINEDVADHGRRIEALEKGGGTGGGGGITVTDDGNGNVTITASAGVSITDDGSGNVTIV
jgi:hypothetical protein